MVDGNAVFQVFITKLMLYNIKTVYSPKLGFKLNSSGLTNQFVQSQAYSLYILY